MSPNPRGNRSGFVAIKELSPDQQAERVKYSEFPNVKGLTAAVHRIDELFSVEVTVHYLRRAITQGRLARHEIGHAIHFSDRGLYDLIVLGTRKASA